MSKSSRLHTIAVPWRKACAALPAVALIGAGIVFGAPAGPARDIKGVAVSNNSSAIVVPETALTMPAVPAPTRPDPYALAADAQGPVTPVRSLPVSSAPALVLPAGTLPGSSAPVALDSTGIPVRALDAYRTAASLVAVADSACHIDWALIAAIGRVESNHARFAGNRLDSAGVAQPGIIGIRLDGTNGTARITDSDGGRLDRDTAYDRAVGPMQFIPSTWRVVGADADGDGVKNPQDMADAATATAIYLCSGPGDLGLPGDLHTAIMRYNASDSYVRTVSAIAAAYRLGVSALPASDLPAASSAPSTSRVVKASTAPAALIPAAPVAPIPAARIRAPRIAAPPTAPIPTAPIPTARIPQAPIPTSQLPPAPIPTLPTAPTAPKPTLPDPCLQTPTVTDPTQPVPTVTDPTQPVPTVTDPTQPVPTVTDPALPVPTVPDPNVPVPCPTRTAGTSASTRLAQEICGTSPLGVKICGIAASSPTATPAPLTSGTVAGAQ